MTIEKRKKDLNDDEKVKFCFRGFITIMKRKSDLIDKLFDQIF